MTIFIETISEELKNNPALIHDETFLKKLSEINNLPYIPEAHKKYNLLPQCHKYGGDVHFCPSSEHEAISALLPEDQYFSPPYHLSYDEYNNILDGYISEYGTTNGKLNELGKMIDDYKTLVQKMNIKENWSVLRYIGESTGYERIFGDLCGFTHGRYYYLAVADIDESHKFSGLIDNEEEWAWGSGCSSLNREEWEIAEDPTGMAAMALLIGDKNERSDN